jgi:molybdopterin-guanine dinucleotide biosynthesis protein A
MQARGKQPAEMSFCHDEVVIVPDVAAAIVAGGRARRFGGRDKSRLLVDGRAIIVRQVEVLRRIAGTVTVVANDRGRFADLDLPVEPDLIPDAGALGGVYTALARAAADRVVVVAGDMPFLDEQVLRRLIALAADADGAWVRTARGVEPLLACYRRHAAPAMRRELEAGRLRAGDIGRALAMASLDETELARFGPVDRLLLNVNAPEDYERAQAMSPKSR